MNFGLISAGRAAADEILVGVFGFPVLIAKAGKPQPYTPAGFDKLVLDLLAEIQAVAYGPEKVALDAALDKLDVDWMKLTKKERRDAIADAAKTFLGLTESIAPKVGDVIQTQGPQIITTTKKAAASKFKLSITPSFNAIDEAIVKAAATHQALFIRDQYGVRSEKFSQDARNIVSAGLAAGKDRYDIGDELRASLQEADDVRGYAYWQMIASVFAARARTFGTLSSFTDAGIQTFMIEAVLDEVTTELCRFMHGKTFSVSAGVKRFEEVAASPNPEDVKTLQPWGGTAKTEGGGSALVYGSGANRKMIATVQASAFGQKDKIGTYGNAMSPGQLQAAGLSCPPFHGHCRTTIIPGEGTAASIAVPEQVAPPAPPVAPPPVPVAPLPPPPAPPAPVVLPANLDALVRPVGTRGVDNETLPALTSAEQAAQATAAHKKAILDALEHALDYGPVKQAPDDAYLPKGFIAHGLKAIPKDATGAPEMPYSPSKDVTPSKLAGAKKQTPTMLPIAELHLPTDFANGKDVAAAMKDAKVDPDAVITVKVGGKFYVYQGQDQVIAAQMKGKTTVYGKVVDLDKFAEKDKKKKDKEAAAAAASAPPAVLPGPAVHAPAAPPPPPPAVKPVPDADDILATKTGSNKGSNDGGFYTGADGTKRYVKFYADPTQAHCEHLANSIYNDLGMGAPESVVFDNKGKPAYASTIFDGGKTLKDAGLTEERAKKFLKGFVGDVLTGNWDAIGTGMDNAMVLPDGRVIRIDNGGSFLFRAQAGKKPDNLLDKITEWDVFFTSRNPYYSQVASAAGVSSPDDMKADVIAGIRSAVALRDRHGGWDAYVRKTIPGVAPADHAKIVGMLDARTTLLQGKLPELTAVPPPAPPPGVARFVSRQFGTTVARPGLKIEDLPEVEAIDASGYGKGRSPDKLPSGEKRAEYEKRTEKSIKTIPANAKQGITTFTGSAYSRIRASEDNGNPDSDSVNIQKAYGKTAPEPGTVYRGIHDLPRAVIDKFTSNETFQLGRVGGGTASSTWNIDVAVDSFMGGRHDGSDYKVLFILNGKSQIPIEAISQFESERELLFKRDSKFRVTGLSRAKGTARVLVLEAEEIEDEHSIGGAPAFGKLR